jgi:hypothetical protein
MTPFTELCHTLAVLVGTGTPLFYISADVARL